MVFPDIYDFKHELKTIVIFTSHDSGLIARARASLFRPAFFKFRN